MVWYGMVWYGMGWYGMYGMYGMSKRVFLIFYIPPPNQSTISLK